MIAIRFKYKGKYKYIREYSNVMVITDDISNAYKYKSTLEFKLSWKILKLFEDGYESYSHKTNILINNDKFKFFEAIDLNTLDVKRFDVRKQEIKINKDLYINPKDFKRLIRCPITSSHWTYDKEDNWISFPDEKDYNRISKISYYRRGLTFTILSSYNNWFGRKNSKSWHSVFDVHHKCMMNPIIQQIALMKFDDCYQFNIHQNEVDIIEKF